jgi:hypothetical protein
MYICPSVMYPVRSGVGCVISETESNKEHWLFLKQMVSRVIAGSKLKYLDLMRAQIVHHY